jgi:mannose-6-phosphate isomerase-like protein (cupin superfamily)
VVVASQDAVLVTRRSEADGMRRLVGAVKQMEPRVTEDHLKVHRPWGSYHALDSGERYQVKGIVVKPGHRLSLQRHKHRAEHWVVVRGTAKVTVGETVKMLHENESIYIPLGAAHRLENPGETALELIEVQTGSYLGEDDIVRLEDGFSQGLSPAHEPSRPNLAPCDVGKPTGCRPGCNCLQQTVFIQAIRSRRQSFTAMLLGEAGHAGESRGGVATWCRR